MTLEDHDQRLKSAVKSKFSDAIDLLCPTWVGKHLLCECLEAYLPLEGVQMNDYDQMLVTPPYQLARKHGKTSFELGELAGQRKVLLRQLAHRFGSLTEEVAKRVETCSETQLLELVEKILSAPSLRDLGLEP